MHVDGARIRLAGGRATLRPAVPTPEGWVSARFSVLSPGTERRRLTATVTGPPKDSGYMAIGGEESRGWLLAPVPHGAPFDPETAGTISAPAGTAVYGAALGRFQLMAALGLARLPGGTDLADAVVVGSGPVALGCVLELYRRGVSRTRVLTARPDASIARAPTVECVPKVKPGSATLVIDAAGVPERAVALVGDGGTLGLLGTPGKEGTLPALAVHRGAWSVIGMHELAGHAPWVRQAAYMDVVTWLRGHVDPLLVASWCRTVPGEFAPSVFASLMSKRRPDAPIIVFSWEA